MNLKRMGIFIIIAFVACFPTSVLAKTYANVICPDNNDPLNVRNAIGGSIITAVPCNGTVEVLDENAGSNSSCNKWYKVIYNGYTGYACGDYMAIVDDGTPTSTISDNVYIRDNYSKPVAGDGTIMCYEDTTDLSLRRTPGGLTTGTKVKCGEVITINSVSEASGTCKYYYNITDSKGNSGYVCGYYVNTTKLSETANKYYNTTEKLDDYYALLREKGFPESYLPYLAEIHARHPNWVFNAEAINLDFDDVVKGESYYGRNLLEMNAFSQNYFSMDINNYSIINDQFYSYSTESGYTSASSEAIAYFLDPRNYLNEKYIFAFEGLDFNETQDAMVVQSILANQTFWPVVYQGFDSNVYDDIVLATRAVGISAAHVASRISQEITGISTTDPRLGGTFNYNSQDYSGYYNFFNIGVYGENKIVNGMVYAMNHGWNTPYNCIYGGSEFLYDGYISVNQDTMYYQKFDVSTTDGTYTHQSMQNLAAPLQETNKSSTT